MDNVLLDSSAWFTLVECEPGADEVEAQVAAAWLELEAEAGNLRGQKSGALFSLHP